MYYHGQFSIRLILVVVALSACFLLVITNPSVFSVILVKLAATLTIASATTLAVLSGGQNRFFTVFAVFALATLLLLPGDDAVYFAVLGILWNTMHGNADVESIPNGVEHVQAIQLAIPYFVALSVAFLAATMWPKARSKDVV